MEEEDGGKKMDAALIVCGSSSSPNEEMTTARTEVQVASRKDLMVVDVKCCVLSDLAPGGGLVVGLCHANKRYWL